MKSEVYLTSSNIEKMTEKWLESLDRKRKWGASPVRKALLVLDMQRFFLEPESHAFIPSGRTIIPGNKETIKEFNGPVIFTKHLKGSTGNLMNEWWNDTIDGELSDIVPELQLHTKTVIEKEHYSAFHGTELEKNLREEGIDSIVITGVLSDLCCESTARDAFMRGFKVYFTADLTATATEERHLSTLKVISNAFGEVISSKELR